MASFADGIIEFLERLETEHILLPQKIRSYNPYTDSKDAHRCSTEFYRKFFDDEHQRHVFFGTNPFRWGAGITGIPFTDARRLTEKCDISYHGPSSQENASAFIYQVIDQLGGPAKFYRKFYFNWLCPVGLFDNDIPENKGFPYFHNATFFNAVKALIVQNIRHLLDIGTERDYCFCVGLGKNEQFLKRINEEYNFFSNIIPLEHPGFITRYHANERDKYVASYVDRIEGAASV